MIHKLPRPYATRNAYNIPYFKVKHGFLINTFFLSVIIEWIKLDPEIQNTPSLNIFKKNNKLYKFKNNFQDTLSPLCTCACNIENACHFLLCCPNFLAERNTFLKKITNIDSNTLNQAVAVSPRHFYLAIRSTPMKSIYKF